MFDEDIKRNLTTLFSKNRVNYIELSKILDINIKQLTSLSEGKNLPSLDDCVKLCIYFNVSLDWLFSGSEPNPVPLFIKNQSNTIYKYLINLIPEFCTQIAIMSDIGRIFNSNFSCSFGHYGQVSLPLNSSQEVSGADSVVSMS